jgi:hypothetical protein
MFRTLLMVNAVAKRNTTLSKIVPLDANKRTARDTGGKFLLFDTQKHLSVTDLSFVGSNPVQNINQRPQRGGARRSEFAVH